MESFLVPFSDGGGGAILYNTGYATLSYIMVRSYDCLKKKNVLMVFDSSYVIIQPYDNETSYVYVVCMTQIHLLLRIQMQGFTSQSRPGKVNIIRRGIYTVYGFVNIMMHSRELFLLLLFISF